jgi:hypothetical protein
MRLQRFSYTAQVGDEQRAAVEAIAVQTWDRACRASGGVPLDDPRLELNWEPDEVTSEVLVWRLDVTGWARRP